MAVPQKTTNELQPEDNADLVPACGDVLRVVPLSGVEQGLAVIESKIAGLETASIANVMTSLADLRSSAADVKKQLAAASVEAVRRSPKAEIEITGDSPAIIVRRSIGEAINRGDLRPGQRVPGKDIILVTVWEPVDRSGKSLGRQLATFGAHENLFAAPQAFDRNAASIAELKDWQGHDGWHFDRQRHDTSSYEEGRFKGYRDGSAIGKWGIPELPVLNGQDRDGNTVSSNANMLALSRDKNSPFYNSFVTIRGSSGAEWSQSCTEGREIPDYVRTVRFPDGDVSWDPRDLENLRSRGRPVVALELSHLIL